MIFLSFSFSTFRFKHEFLSIREQLSDDQVDAAYFILLGGTVT